MFSKSVEVKQINDIVVTSNKLVNRFAGAVTSGLVPDVAHRPPVGLALT
jgi:hypothetical protein